ncbi:MAG: cobyrinate a,c-diamide synthase [Pseudomonadota bacterium]
MNGFMVAAPHSGSGKTVVTLGLLRALKRRGMPLSPYKAGPDYIDPAFHRAASGETCVNLDPWGMRPALIYRLTSAGRTDCLRITEAMMGLFDGAQDDTGSAADLAAMLGLPVVLVVDASRMGQSVAALVNGYRSHRRDVEIAGVILNRVGSARHRAMLERALAPLGVRILGVVMGDPALQLPSRHLGLVQAGEHEALEAFIEAAANAVEAGCDLEALIALPLSSDPKKNVSANVLAPLGQHIAVAQDQAFAFAYPHLLEGWRKQGAELSFFSPLADESPDVDADAVFLPGGYPELHAPALAAAKHFRAGMSAAMQSGALIYGECGGYMVLGDALVDADGASHAMLGLLPVTTSFAKRKRHLGYRLLEPVDIPMWRHGLRGHEFHYSTMQGAGNCDPLFRASDALGNDLGAVGQRVGRVMGSYMHVIDQSA